jgi:hypothetical protein
VVVAVTLLPLRVISVVAVPRLVSVVKSCRRHC